MRQADSLNSAFISAVQTTIAASRKLTVCQVGTKASNGVVAVTPRSARFPTMIAGLMSMRASKYHASTLRLFAGVVVAAVRGHEHGDGRSAVGFDLLVVLCSRLIEACNNQEIGPFEKRSEQAGGPERIGHV